MAKHNVPRWTPGPVNEQNPLNPRSDIFGSTGQYGATDPNTHDYFPFGDSTAPPSLRHQLSSIRRSRKYGSNSSIESVAISMPHGVGYNAQQSIRKDRGFLLTWEDLCVSAVGKGGNVPILSRLNGFARPGEVLAIMGPSGCGKSTLLDTLAGRLETGVTQTGQILINGRHQKLAFGTSAYVTQDDVLMTTLTVREAVYYSAQLQLPDSMSLGDKRKRAEETIEEMGLTGAANTKNWRVGAQRHKRGTKEKGEHMHGDLDSTRIVIP